MINTNKYVLFIVTNTSSIGPNLRQTGYEFSEVAHPYLAFKANGIHVDFASLNGGRPPEDGYDASDFASALFKNSRGFDALNDSMKLAEVDLKKYDGIFFPGGLGPMVDLVDNKQVKSVVKTVYENERVVGAVCHGPVALMNVTLSDGSNLLEGKRVACFTEEEEKGHSKEDVPFMLDSALILQGASHTHATPFAAHVIVDGKLITGQNPASAAGVASEMMKIL